jgi:hypothetical protein
MREQQFFFASFVPFCGWINSLLVLSVSTCGDIASRSFDRNRMTYIKIMLTLLVIATAYLAFELGRFAPPSLAQPYPSDAVLDRSVDHLELTDSTFEQAVAALSRKTGVPIEIDWQSFEGWDASRGNRHAITFDRTSLQRALSDIGMVYADLLVSEFRTKADGTLCLYGANTPGETRERIYDVQDLLTDQYWGVKSDPGSEQTNQADRLRSLVSFLDAHIGDSGPLLRHRLGSAYSIRGLAGKLFVCDTRSGQQEVESLLAWLRRMK